MKLNDEVDNEDDEEGDNVIMMQLKIILHEG